MTSEHTSSIPLGSTERRYLPGMGLEWLLPLYDPLTRLLGLRATHRQLVEHAKPRGGERALEIGCGTGNLAILLKETHPGVDVVGLDPDSRALARAKRKADHKSLQLEFKRGFAEELPYSDDSFDLALSAFMFHHLSPAGRRAALEEIERVLRPGGHVHLLDFGGHVEPSDGLMGRLARRSRHLADNLDDRIPALMRQAGLLHPTEIAHGVTRVGRCTFYRAGAGSGETVRT